jgi:CRISPR-associated exonuclease Cas4
MLKDEVEFKYEDDLGPLVFRVVDLKQWFVCRRIVYYHYVLPAVRPTTYSMAAGKAAHEEVRPLEKRRTLHVYGVPDGQRHFDVWLYAPDLGLSGLVDLVIEREDEVIPVDFKDSLNLKAQQFRLQVAAYGVLLEHVWQRPVKRGFVYSLPGRRVEEVKLTAKMRSAVRNAVAEMREVVLRGMFPEPPAGQRICVTCEFRRFCNDVL